MLRIGYDVEFYGLVETGTPGSKAVQEVTSFEWEDRMFLFSIKKSGSFNGLEQQYVLLLDEGDPHRAELYQLRSSVSYSFSRKPNRFGKFARIPIVPSPEHQLVGVFVKQ